MWSRITAASVGGLVVLVVAAPVIAAPVAAPAPAAGVAAPGVAAPFPGVAAPFPGVATGGLREQSPASREGSVCQESELDFARRWYVEQRGDVARVTLLVGDSVGDSPIYLRIAAEEGPYVATATVRDGDEDGRVTLLLDTGGAAGPAERLRTAAAGDEAFDREFPSTGGISPGSYDFSVLTGSCAQAYATFVVEDPTAVAVTAYRGDRDLLANLTSPAAVREALTAGALRPSHRGDRLSDREGVPVLRGETLALVVEAPDLAPDHAAVGGLDDTDAIRALLGQSLTVRVVEAASSVADDEVGPERHRLSNFGDWRAFADPGNDTYYLLVDTRAPYDPDDGSTDYGRVGERFVVTVETDAGSDTSAFEFAAPAAALDASDVEERVVLPATAGATVTGTTDLPDNATLSVTLRSETGAFPLTRNATVDDGRFAAAFDLAGVGHGTQFEAVVRHGGARVAAASGRVEAAATVAFEAATVTAASRRPNQVTVDRVSLTDGGFVVVHDGYFGGPVAGTSAYLPPGNHTDVTVQFDEPLDGTATLAAVVHRDDGDRRFDLDADPAYEVGSPEETVEFVRGAGTPTEAPAPPSATPRSPSSDGIPGPGPGVALGAVVLVALAARARLSREG